MALRLALLGRKDVDVDGMASEPRRDEIPVEKYLDTSPWGCSSFRRLVVCREGASDGLEELDEPALPSTWQASDVVIRPLNGFKPCIGHD
jgi:hypothetical protein